MEFYIVNSNNTTASFVFYNYTNFNNKVVLIDKNNHIYIRLYVLLKYANCEREFNCFIYVMSDFGGNYTSAVRKLLNRHNSALDYKSSMKRWFSERVRPIEFRRMGESPPRIHHGSRTSKKPFFQSFSLTLVKVKSINESFRKEKDSRIFRQDLSHVTQSY